MTVEEQSPILPYIEYPNENLKILIDTGSTKSFVNPAIANKYFKKNIQKDPFIIATAHGESKENFSTFIPLGKLFNQKELNLKFYLFKFNRNFDILLGIDNLKNLKANISLTRNELVTPNAITPLKFLNTQEKHLSLSLAGNSEQIIKIPIQNLKEGNGIIPNIKFKDIEIPEGLVKVEDSKALCTIKNLGKNTLQINIKNPIVVTEIVEDEINQFKIFENNNIESKDAIISQLHMDHMNEEEKTAIINLIKHFSDIFYSENSPLTFTNQIKHEIQTKDEIPIYAKTYRYPEIHKNEIQTQINKMLEQKIIQPSHSPWNAPVWVVPKKLDNSGKRKWRLVIDYRKLNDKTIDDKYPIPNITDLLDKLGKCNYFSTLDLASGFHQVEMKENSIQKTAFSVDKGHYEFLRMPFGLKNSPPTFQRVMDNVLRGLDNVIVYLDDILIFSSGLQEHINNLKLVFSRLKETNFKIQLDKTEFCKKEVSYLGHLVTPLGVKPNPQKIQCIQNFPIPKTEKEIKSFLGLLGYYRRFIPNFAQLTKPFTKCLKKNSKIDIKDPNYLECFDKCKNILSNNPILQYPDYSKIFNLTTDASNVAVGAVLSQNFNNADLPIAYASRTLNESEQHLSTIEKELLAVVWATKHFRPYLYGRHFNIYCDHKPLQWLFSIKEPNSKLMRWRLKLEEFDYEIKYKKGSENKVADALSRIELNMNEANTGDNEIDEMLDQFFQEHPSIADEVFGNNQQIDVESIVANFDETEDNNETIDDDETDGDTIHSNNDGNTIITIPIIEGPVNTGQNQIVISTVEHSPAKPKIINLLGNKKRIIIQISKSNIETDIINFVKSYIIPKIKYSIYFEDDIYKEFYSVMARHFKDSEINLVKNTKKLIDVVDEEEIIEIIDRYHTGKTNHRGIDETEERIKNVYYWPNLRKYVQDFINKCEICKITKYDRNPLKIKLNITPNPNKPFEIIHIDTITFERTKFLTLIDTFSRYAQAYKLKSGQAIEVVNKLIKFFSRHNTPNQIICDNGTEFNNSLVKELLALHKIQIHFTSSQHPESNGPVERLHSTLIEHIRLFNNQDAYKKDSISNKVRLAILAYNNTIHSITKLKPIDLINGHISNETPFAIDLEAQILNDYINTHKEKTKLLYKKVNEINSSSKEKTISRVNQNREDAPDLPEEIFVKNKQKQSKTKNKYTKQKLKSLNKTLKTAEIEPKHHNIQEKIHLSNVQRPRKIKKTSNNFSGPSGSRKGQK